MKRKGKESKLNSTLTAVFVFLTCILSFSVGVISGKGLSDRAYKIKHIENDSHLKAAMDDTEPLGSEMTQKEVELLTQRALSEAKAENPLNTHTEAQEPAVAPANNIKATDDEDSDELAEDEEQPQDVVQEQKIEEKSTPQSEISTAQKTEMNKEEQRNVSSLPPQPTTPKPASIEYTVQVAAYKTLKEAEAHSQKLIDKGFPAFPVKVMIDNQLWYRVSIGSFKSRKQAIRYEQNLKKQAVVSSTFVQKIERVK